MKKNRINAFTLVEMLIVIVIIGILIAALMPRMQAAQGRARDVSRKTALSQIQSAIVVSQGDKGRRPGTESGGNARTGTSVSEIGTELKNAGMNSIPTDPLKNRGWGGLGDFAGTADGDYGYLVTKRNGSSDGGFVLMAQTEVEGGSNWVFCSGSNNDDETANFKNGVIRNDTDIAQLTICQTVSKRADSTEECVTNTGTCYYQTEDQLRYIVIY